jgi:hypothetical protein
MERQAKIRELINRYELNGLAERLALESAEINLPLIEQLKQEVDLRFRKDVRSMRALG